SRCRSRASRAPRASVVTKPRPRPPSAMPGTHEGLARECCGSLPWSALRLEVVRKVREVLGAGLGGEDEDREADTTEPLPVQARLERDDVARHELFLARLAEPGPPLPAQPAPMPKALVEAFAGRLPRLLLPL